MSRVVLTPGRVIIFFVVLIVVLFILFDVLLQAKIGASICKITGIIIYAGLDYTGLFSGLTLQALTAGCDLIPL